mmetsp:Transcript_37858/g.109232  ORF Transcript_37858/g.109232 Transcript_37858/m.109232 type:complete len:273 (-) Transcript_37858:294-1112(-)
MAGLAGTIPMPAMRGAHAADAPLVASGPPLDYSFKELRSCAELETEEPRSGTKRAPPESPPKDAGAAGAPGAEPAAGEAPNEDAAIATSTMRSNAPHLSASTTAFATRAPAPAGKPLKRVMRMVTTSIKLNNNMLETVSGLPMALEFVMPNPVINLQWVDLSFNQLVTIEPDLLRFVNLKALYLHGNCIKALSAVDRLKKLSKLVSLTMNGNPIESSRVYRTYVIGAVPQLRSLDHSTITQDEVSASAAWYKGHQERARKRAEARENAGVDD